MKARNYIFWIGLLGILFCILLQFCAVPVINKAHSGYSAQDRARFCELRETIAREHVAQNE